MNKTKIEHDGITYLQMFLAQSKILEPHIQSNDRYPSWDGEIIIYKIPNNQNKNNVLGRVPVQIKSTNRQSKKKETISIDVSDLKNYLNDGGVVLIRPIYLGIQEYKIYTSILLPVQLQKYISKAKKKSVSVDLEIVNNIKHFEGLITFFLENKKLQFNYNETTVSEYLKDGISEFVIKSFGESLINKIVFDRLSFIYIKEKHDLLVPTGLEISSLQQENILNIRSESINLKSLYSKYYRNGMIEIAINSILKIIINDNKAQFKLKLNDESKIVDIPKAFAFIESIVRSKCIYINEKVIRFNVRKDKEVNITEIKQYWEYVLQVIKGARIDATNITISEIKKCTQDINILIKILIKNEPVEFDDNSNNIVVKTYDIINKKIVIIYTKSNCNSYYGIDLMSIDQFQAEIVRNEVGIKCSRFLVLQVIFTNKLSEYISCLNGYEEEVIEDLTKKYQEELNDSYIYYILGCIKGYDNGNLPNGLRIAEAIIEIIISKKHNMELENILIINKFQILYRKDEFKKEHENVLKEMLNSNRELHELKCCIYILMGYPYKCGGVNVRG